MVLGKGLRGGAGWEEDLGGSGGSGGGGRPAAPLLRMGSGGFRDSRQEKGLTGVGRLPPSPESRKCVSSGAKELPSPHLRPGWPLAPEEHSGSESVGGPLGWRLAHLTSPELVSQQQQGEPPAPRLWPPASPHPCVPADTPAHHLLSHRDI